MPRRFLPGLVLFGWVLASPTGRADYLVLDLKAESAGGSKSAPSEILGVGVKPMPRAVLEVKAPGRVTVRWAARHAAAAGTVKNVLLHLVVVREEKLGQLAVPKLDKGVVAESALTADFQPKDETTGELTLTLDQPGFYLLRLETIGAAVGAEGHEHYAALDLAVR